MNAALLPRGWRHLIVITWLVVWAVALPFANKVNETLDATARLEGSDWPVSPGSCTSDSSLRMLNWHSCAWRRCRPLLRPTAEPCSTRSPSPCKRRPGWRASYRISRAKTLRSWSGRQCAPDRRVGHAAGAGGLTHSAPAGGDGHVAAQAAGALSDNRFPLDG